MRGTDFAELTAFAAVAEQRSFAKAAARLGIAPSTLSQTIRALEERLGVRLLNRTTRSVAPTEAGALMTELQPALEGVGRAIESVNAFRDKPMGTLRLLTGRAVATAGLAPMLGAFHAAYPEITLDVVSEDSRVDLAKGHFDAGLRVGELIERDMIAVRLFEALPMICVAAPRYLERREPPLTPDALQTHACIRHRWGLDGIIHPWQFEKDGARIEIAVNGPLIVNDLNFALSAAVSGAGIAYLAHRMAARLISNKQLVPMLQDWCPAMSGVYIYYPGRRQIPAPLQAFIAFARKEVNRASSATRLPYTAGSRAKG